MADYNPNNLNFMEEMREMIWEIDELKPEPEMCNASCPPFGCPSGLCPGMCSSNGIIDPYCISTMPKNVFPSTYHPSRSHPSLSHDMASSPIAHSHSSYSQKILTPSNGLAINRVSHTTPYQSAFHQNQNQCNSMSECQVPSVHNNNRSHGRVPFSPPNPNLNSTHQSYSSTIEVCYPSIRPTIFPASNMILPIQNGQQVMSPPHSPRHNPPQYHYQYQTQNFNPQFSVPSNQLSYQQLCPPNSSYIVTIPRR